MGRSLGIPGAVAVALAGVAVVGIALAPALASWLAGEALGAHDEGPHGGAPTGGGDSRGPSSGAGVGAIVGRVRDPDGEGVPGARVRIPAHGLEAVTDAAGAFRFHSVPVGRVLLRAEADGYASNVRTVNVKPEVIHQVNLRVRTATSAPPPDVSVHEMDGRIACAAVVLGAGISCEGSTVHTVNLTHRAVEAVVELVWDDSAEAALNLTASGSGAADPATGRHAGEWGAAEGASALRLLVPIPDGAERLHVGVAHAAARAGLPDAVAYSVRVTVFYDAPAPMGYGSGPP